MPRKQRTEGRLPTNFREEETMSTESRIPRILEQAPDFEAKSTHGVIKLSDYTTKGKYVLLFSHPSDFTRVHHRVY
jgi:hypothetical protein